jgi:hypothetical protein
MFQRPLEPCLHLVKVVLDHDPHVHMLIFLVYVLSDAALDLFIAAFKALFQMGQAHLQMNQSSLHTLRSRQIRETTATTWSQGPVQTPKPVHGCGTPCA